MLIHFSASTYDDRAAPKKTPRGCTEQVDGAIELVSKIGEVIRSHCFGFVLDNEA